MGTLLVRSGNREMSIAGVVRCQTTLYALNLKESPLIMGKQLKLSWKLRQRIGDANHNMRPPIRRDPLIAVVVIVMHVCSSSTFSKALSIFIRRRISRHPEGVKFAGTVLLLHSCSSW